MTELNQNQALAYRYLFPFFLRGGRGGGGPHPQRLTMLATFREIRWRFAGAPSLSTASSFRPRTISFTSTQGEEYKRTQCHQNGRRLKSLGSVQRPSPSSWPASSASEPAELSATEAQLVQPKVIGSRA